MTGLIHIYTGDGKGKTSAACGLALRCAHYGGKIVIAQFIKSGESGEIQELRRLPNVCYFGGNPTGKFSFQMNEDEKRSMAKMEREVLAQAVEAARDASMLVLDEVMAAISCGFLETEQIAALLKAKPDALEVVLTGRNPPQALIELADYVSLIQKIKHPYDRGIAARQGIER